jgi:hypothetical protein
MNERLLPQYASTVVGTGMNWQPVLSPRDGGDIEGNPTISKADRADKVRRDTVESSRDPRSGIDDDDDDPVGRNRIQNKPARGEDLEPATVKIP